MFLEPRKVYDIAFLGWGHRLGDEGVVSVYDWQLLCRAVMEERDCDCLEAADYVCAEIEGAWVGPSTPLVIHRGTPYDLEQLL